MIRLIVIVISMTLSTLNSFSVHAQEANLTLFAVDLSLSAEQRNSAYDVIREKTVASPADHSIGLTLFDDTVRRFVALATLDASQKRNIDQTLAESLVSVRASSNLAVGIERAIDNLKPGSPANLIVFSRGVIDTPTQDPRARFYEWLELILLPQAAQENIAITLVIPNDQSMDPAIKQAFDSESSHKIVVSTPGENASPVLISLLGITDRLYGELDPDLLSTAGNTTTTNSQLPNVQSDHGTAIDVNNAAVSKAFELWVIARIPLLIIATIVFCGIVFWRYRPKKPSPRQNQDTTVRSSTYLPLTEKPSKTMSGWIEEEDVPVHSAPSKPIKSASKEKEPWD